MSSRVITNKRNKTTSLYSATLLKKHILCARRSRMKAYGSFVLIVLASLNQKCWLLILFLPPPCTISKRSPRGSQSLRSLFFFVVESFSLECEQISSLWCLAAAVTADVSRLARVYAYRQPAPFFKEAYLHGTQWGSSKIETARPRVCQTNGGSTKEDGLGHSSHKQSPLGLREMSPSSAAVRRARLKKGKCEYMSLLGLWGDPSSGQYQHHREKRECRILSIRIYFSQLEIYKKGGA